MMPVGPRTPSEEAQEIVVQKPTTVKRSPGFQVMKMATMARYANSSSLVLP